MVSLSPSTLWIVAGLAIVVGYVANLLFKRYKIPDILVILLFGWLVGPSAFGIIGLNLRGLIESLIPFVSSLTLAIIMFNGGLELNLKDIKKVARTTVFLSVLGMFLVVISIALFVLIVLRADLITSVFSGVVFGSTSAAVVLPLISRIRCSSKVKTIITLETAITDVLVVGLGSCIVVLMAQSQGPEQSLLTLLTSIVIAIVLGTISGLAWLYATPFLSKFRYFYILTMAAVLLLFSACIILAPDGGNVIGVLIFGLILSNSHNLPPLPGRKNVDIDLGEEFKLLNDEMSFFIKVFFFTYLGVFISTLNLAPLLGYGLAFVLILFGIRQVMIHMIKKRAALDDVDVLVMRTMFPRGLCTVITALLPFTSGVTLIFDQDAALGTVALVIIITTILASVGATLVELKLKRDDGKAGASKECDIKPVE